MRILQHQDNGHCDYCSWFLGLIAQPCQHQVPSGMPVAADIETALTFLIINHLIVIAIAMEDIIFTPFSILLICFTARCASSIYLEWQATPPSWALNPRETITVTILGISLIQQCHVAHPTCLLLYLPTSRTKEQPKRRLAIIATEIGFPACRCLLICLHSMMQ